MSGNYECQAEVFPCAQEDRNTVVGVLEQWGLELECDTLSFDNEDHDDWSFWGSIQLTNGKTEEDKHDQLRALLPDRALTTRWRWVDDQKWDDVIETEPLKPCQKQRE